MNKGGLPGHGVQVSTIAKWPRKWPSAKKGKPAKKARFNKWSQLKSERAIRSVLKICSVGCEFKAAYRIIPMWFSSSEAEAWSYGNAQTRAKESPENFGLGYVPSALGACCSAEENRPWNDPGWRKHSPRLAFSDRWAKGCNPFRIPEFAPATSAPRMTALDSSQPIKLAEESRNPWQRTRITSANSSRVRLRHPRA